MGTRSAGKPSIPDEQAARVVAAIKWLRETRFDSDTALGKEIGRSQPGVSNIVLGKSKASLDTATRVAALIGVEVWSLLRGEWTPGGRPTIPLSTSPFAVGAAAAVFDGATREDVDTVMATVDPADPKLSWNDAYRLVTQARTDRILAPTKPTKFAPRPAESPQSHAGGGRAVSLTDHRDADKAAKLLLDAAKAESESPPKRSPRGVKSARTKPKD